MGAYCEDHGVARRYCEEEHELDLKWYNFYAVDENRQVKSTPVQRQKEKN